MVLVCGLGGAAVLLGVVSQRAGRLPSVYEQAKKSGLAVELSDLTVTVPPERDAYPWVAKAARQLKKEDPKKISALGAVMLQVLNFRGDYTSEERLQRAQWELGAGLGPIYEMEGVFARRSAMAKRNGSTAGAFRPALSIPKPEVRLDARGYTPGVVLDFMIQLRCAEAILASERHSLSEAVFQLADAVQLLRIMESERGYLAFRRQGWAHVMIHRALAKMIQEMPDRKDVPQAASDLSEALGPPPSIRRHLGGELAIALDAIKKRKKEDIEYLPFADAFKDMGRADVVRIFTHTVQQLPEDPNDVEGARKALIQMDAEGGDAPIYGGYATGYRAMEFLVRDVIARERLQKVALALLGPIGEGETFTGLPESLGESRIDPHSGQSFRLKDTPAALVVYSVGKDGYDDGGLESPPTRMGIQTRDIIFAIPKKGHRPDFQGPTASERGWEYQKERFLR